MSPLVALGQPGELTIKDTSGFTRAVSKVEGTGIVEFELVDTAGAPAEGIEVTLTNTATGQTLTSSAVNGTATFHGVQSGVWTVASSTTQVTFTNIAIGSGAVVAAAGGGMVAGSIAPIAAGTAVVGGATAIAVNRSGSSSGDDEGEVLSPSS